VTGRPVAILMLFIAAVVFGYFSYGRLDVTLMPELTYPTITVRTEYPGAAPEEVENDISRPIEEGLGVIGGLQKLSSVSRTEISDVILEFAWETDMSEATQDVLERLDMVFLPDEARRPLILHFDPSLDPVLELSLSGRGDAFRGEEGLRRLRRLADLQVKRILEPIKGIAAVRVQGGLEEEIHILLEEEQLRRTNISIQRVIDRLSQENINVAGGMIQEGRTEYLVRTLNEYVDLQQIEDTIVDMFDGREVRVGDLGRVARTHKERQIITRTDGRESVHIQIFKEADANVVALAKRVKAAVGRVNLEDEEEAAPDEDLIAAAGEENAAEPDTGDTTAGEASTSTASDRGPRQGGGGLAQQLYREEGAVLQLVADRSIFIESSIKEVRNTAILGGLLAIVVLFLFLRNFRTTVIVAASIPISLLVTFAPLHLLGVSLNIMSLGGLALGIGMLVDSSIVVLESIHRCREEGDDIVSAAIRGTAEVRAAVTASILTSIAVFFPMVFVEGVAGQAFGDLGVAVVVSLLASLAVAIYLIPMLASRRGIKVARLSETGPALGTWSSWQELRRSLRESRRWQKLLVFPVLYWILRFVIGLLLELLGKLALILFMAFVFILNRFVVPATRVTSRVVWTIPLRLVQAAISTVQNGYPTVLRWALARPMTVLGLVALTFLVTWQVARGLDSELLPEVRQGEFTVEVSLPVGTPLEETETILSPIEKAILAEKQYIRAMILTVGYDPTQSERSDEGEHTASFKILLEPSRWGYAREDEVVERLRHRFEGIPDLKSRISRPVLFSSKTPIEVEVLGEDLTLIKRQTDRVSTVMAGMPELADVTTTLQSGAPEIQVVYNRELLARYGLNIQQVARLVRDKVQGNEATRFNLLDRTIPIVVQLREEDRRSIEDVEGLVVNPGGDRPILLSSVAQVVVGEGPSEVRRVDSQRVGLVRANLGSGSLSGAVDRIHTLLGSRMEWPPSMTYLISGQNEEWERSRWSLVLALGLSIFLVYVIMAIQFESLIHPLVIMVTIPLAFIGTILVLRVLGIPISIVVFLGMIMLAGIVVNNAIVLVDYINQLRRRGLPRHEAIVTAGSVRLRPILMTTATTVLGLTPMAIGLGDGAEIRSPMAISVMSGLIASTVLTLLIIPTVYDVADRLLGKLVRSSEEHMAEAALGAAPEGFEPAGSDS
jgi:HAE1 family hydrophobic/amphiphilic exporter-1